MTNLEARRGLRRTAKGVAASLLLAGATMVMAGICARAADQALIDAATKEGHVMWYTGLLVDEAVQPILNGFMKKYPGIVAEFDRSHPITAGQFIIEQSKAGIARADVADGTATPDDLDKAGLLARYSPESSKDIPAIYKDPEGRWTAQVLYFTTLGFNTDLVSKADVPKTFADLLDPKWKGKMGWSADTLSGGPGFIANVLAVMGEKDGMAYLEKLSAQQIKPLPGLGAQALQAVADGQVAIGLQIFAHHIKIQQGKGGHVEWIPFEPLMGFTNPIALAKNAPHPNAGKLLIDFIASEEGQTILRAGKHIPSSSKVAPLDASLKGDFKVTFLTPEMTSRDNDRWVALRKKLFP